MQNNHVDVLIMGAGISGIGSAYHLKKHCPNKTFVILEAREAMGGTWDLFRYPGIRSDSEMYTFGFNFKPWTGKKCIAPGAEIKSYIEEAASENGIDQHIRYGHKISTADWSDDKALWTITAENLATGESVIFTCHFFFSCGGYYNYDSGFTPDFKGIEDYKGTVIHPQHWPEAFDHSDKDIVVIGSGATAITLIPSLAKTASKVTMLQRSPTYMASRPDEDRRALKLQEWLPAKMAYSINRWRSILFGMATYALAKKRPEYFKKFLLDSVRRRLGDDFDIDKHFTPSYQPWDQRVCLVPYGDLFKAIRRGDAEVVTDHIDHFTETGIQLKSGEHLTTDVVVTATGLKAELFSGLQILVNGSPVNIGKTYSYKGMMLTGIPNFAFSVGYTNASWTLKSDLVGEYVCRVLNHMDKHNKKVCVTETSEDNMATIPLLDLQSGYIKRAKKNLPKQGTKKPWKLYQNYILDRISLGMTPVTDDIISYR